jgi:hypothetical protein
MTAGGRARKKKRAIGENVFFKPPDYAATNVMMASRSQNGH